MKVCPRCNIPRGTFPLACRSSTRYGVKTYNKNICKECVNHQQRFKRELHKTHTAPDIGTPCDCCSNVRPLFLDQYGFYRGHICRQCNLGIGLLGDDMAGVTAALLYFTT